MKKNEKIWQRREVDEDSVSALKHKLGCSSMMAYVLAGRDIDADQVLNFINPSLKNLKDPSVLIDMDKAIDRLILAIERSEQIGIFGDYDVDGVSSASILYQFLSELGLKPFVLVPHRLRDGYGLNINSVDKIKEAKCTLLITADCGITAHEAITYANSLNIDVIVVDHHTVAETLPPAHAVIDPHRLDCGSGLKYLCAAGLCFYLCIGLRRALRERGFFKSSIEPDLKKLLDLVALATVCDVVPLIADNRALVNAGLKIIKNVERPGLKALINACGIDKDRISSTNLGFHLGPRINAAGRLIEALEAFLMLTSPDYSEALAIAQNLDATNMERRELEEITVNEATQQILDNGLSEDLALVVYDEKWHPGVVGIVASRITEKFYRPAIVIGEHGKGSGRSITGVDLHKEVSKVSYLLKGFGGHAHAIGVTLGPAGVIQFRKSLNEAMSSVAKDIYIQKYFYDAEIFLRDITLSLIKEIAQLEPFGAKNPYPVFRVNKVNMRNLKKLNGGHIKGELESVDGYASFIGFRMNIDDELSKYPLDVLGVIEENHWQGRLSLQLRLIDYKKSPQYAGLF